MYFLRFIKKCNKTSFYEHFTNFDRFLYFERIIFSYEIFPKIFHPLSRLVASKKKNGLTEPINLVSGGCGNGVLDFSQSD